MSTAQPHADQAPTAGDVDRHFGVAVEHFLNSVSDAFALIDGNGRVLRANIAFRRLTGPAGGAHDASILSFLEAEKRDAGQEALRSLGEKTPSRALQLRFRIGNQTRLIDADLTWLGPEGVISFVGRDVTRQDTLERERQETATARDAVEQIGNIGHWRAGRDFRLQCSPGAARILGLDPAAPPLVLSDLVEMIDPEDRSAAVANAREAFDKQRPLNSTVRIKRPDGSWRTIQVAGAASIDARGSIEALHGVVVDKTDVQAALHAAMNADTTVRRFVQAAPMAVAMYDRDMRVLMCSRTYLQERRLTEDQVLGRCAYDLMPWMPEKWRQSHRHVMRGETLRHDRDRFEGPNGKVGWLKWTCAPWRDGSGEIGGIVVIHENVTEFVTAQHDVESSRERMVFGLSMSAMMILEIDFENQQMHLEGGWKHLLPQEPNFDSFTGVEPWVHPADRDVLMNKWKAHLAGAPPYTVEYRVIHPDGHEVWQSASIRILKSVMGAPARAFVVVQDISGRKQVEMKAMAADQRALVAAAAKSDFLSNMSHEIRTPLNGVLAVSEVLGRTPLDERQSEMVRLISTSGRTLLRVMDDLVEFSRLEGEEIDFDIRPFELEETLRSTCEAARTRAEAKGIGFESFISATVDGVFRGDPQRVSQVLGNLLNNAVKFTESGRINVNAEVHEDAFGQTTLKLTVIDTGVGFSPEFAERIFDRFEQADASNSRRYGGLGLGLSIVKRLVDLMHGAVKASSIEGDGSTFEVTLPLARDRIAALGAISTVAVEDFDAETTIENLRLLVAEDNPMNRRVVELLLANSGMEIHFAENGREALEKFKERKYDMVLMDLQMPVMGGLAATRAIREWEKTGHRAATPIIAVSANATIDHVEEAKAAGADDHVAKPIVRETLFEAIARYARPQARMQDVEEASDIEFNLDDLDIAV